MKNLKLKRTTILLSILLSISFAKAQNYYSLSVDNKPYADITGGTLITKTFSNNVDFITIPYQQKLFNQDPGTSWQIGKNGYIVAIGAQFSFAVDPFVSALSKKDSTSSIEYKVEVTGGDSVIIIQWKNMKLDKGGMNDYINMQCKIFKSSQAIEFHYGPSSVTTSDSGDLTSQCGVFWLTKDFTQSYEYNNLKGTSTAPQLDRNPQNTASLSGFPANSTVFMFSKNNSTGIENRKQLDIELYPNPVTDKLFIKNSDEIQFKAYTITDISGRQLIKSAINNLEKYISLTHLQTGVYFITLYGENEILTKKIIKK